MAITDPLPDLTKPEFDILRVLWKKKRLNVRETHTELTETYDWAYSTTKTMMDRMVKKGLLAREAFHGVYLYTPLLSRPRGFAKFIKFFADRVLELDHGSVVALFAHSSALTEAEIEELTILLDREKNKHME